MLQRPCVMSSVPQCHRHKCRCNRLKTTALDVCRSLQGVPTSRAQADPQITDGSVLLSEDAWTDNSKVMVPSSEESVGQQDFFLGSVSSMWDCQDCLLSPAVSNEDCALGAIER